MCDHVGLFLAEAQLPGFGSGQGVALAQARLWPGGLAPFATIQHPSPEPHSLAFTFSVRCRCFQGWMLGPAAVQHAQVAACRR